MRMLKKLLGLVSANNVAMAQRDIDLDLYIYLVRLVLSHYNKEKQFINFHFLTMTIV